MSFERYPLASATTTTDTPVVITPGKTINWPVQTVLRIDATPEGATGWSHNNDPKAGAVSVYYTRRSTGSADLVIKASQKEGPASVNPTPSLSIFRTVRGLIRGRQYRLSARVTPDGGGTRVRIRMGGQVPSGWVTALNAMTTQTVTFTATGDEEDLIIECEDNPASSVSRAGIELAVASITLTGLAYVQNIPAVVDDQVALTVHDDGKITADAGWAPFIQADITVPAPSADVAATLDPNDGSRVKITASAVRDFVRQFTPWTITRRNLHPDPGHTGASRVVGSGILMSCYQPLPAHNAGTTDKPNRFERPDAGSVPQDITVKTLPAGGVAGFSVTTNPPPTGTTRARLYLDVQLNTYTGGGAVPATLRGVVRVVQGTTVLHVQDLPMPANGLAFLTVNDVALDTPTGTSGIRVEVSIENRGAATWTTPGTTGGVYARVTANSFSIADGDVSAGYIVSDSITFGPPLSDYMRNRKADNTVVQETRQDAPSIIQTVDERTFDLAIAETETVHRDGTLRLTLASDEYLLQRFAKRVNDAVPRTREHSLRSVIEYVLGEVLGSVPPLEGTVDGNVTARWAVDNIVSNSSFETGLDGWAPGSNATGFTRVNTTPWGAVQGTYAARWSSVAAGVSYLDYANISIRAGAPYVFLASMFTESGTRNARIMLRFKNAEGRTIRDVYSAAAPATDGRWNQFSVQGVAPQGAAQASLHIEHQATAAGQSMRADGIMLYEGTEVVPFFNGALATPGYTVSWSGTAHASTSTREPLVPRDPQALIWSVGQTAWEFLTPLVNSLGLRLWCDEKRTWHLTDPNAYTAPGRLTVTPATTVEITDRVDGERGDYADGVVITWRWTDAAGSRRSWIESAGNKGKITNLEFEAAFPGLGTAAAVLAKLQGRGTERPLTIATDYRATPDQPITINAPDGTASEGKIAAVSWNLSDGLMDVQPVALTRIP